MIPAIIALISGVLFSAGLCISGMVRPDKIRAVLDFASGAWDPTMMLVMATGTAVCAVAWRFARAPRTPPFGEAYPGPPSKTIDLRLVGGSAVFGIGWGISGLCPSTAVPSVVTFLPGAYMFGAAMLVGMVFARYATGADGPPAYSKLGGAEKVAPSEI